jgi:hypothetical protein
VNEEEPTKSRWIVKKYISMANDQRGGDYRRVTEETWNCFLSMYPGSGPAITMIYTYDSKYHDSGYYPTDDFKILGPPPNPGLKKEKQSYLSMFWSSGKSSPQPPSITPVEQAGLHMELAESKDDEKSTKSSVYSPILESNITKSSEKNIASSPYRPLEKDEVSLRSESNSQPLLKSPF